MLTKKPFERTTVTYNTNTDMGLSASHQFAFWADPSRHIVVTLVDTIMANEERLNKMSDDEKRQMDTDWWNCVSKVIVDCDIEGLDFSTPEAAKASFDNEEVSWGWLLDVMGFYIGRLLAENKRLGELLKRLNAR
jgi:hypothetical protein